MTFLIGCSFHAAAIADHFRALAVCLLEKGHRVILLTWGRDCDSHFGVEGAELLRFPSVRPTEWKDIRFAYEVMRSRRVDCAVANFGSGNAITLGAVLARVPARVVWYHTLLSQILRDRGGADARFLLQALRQRAVFGLASVVVGNSGAAREELVRVWKLPRSKVEMFWYCIPDPLRAGREAGERLGAQVLCPGRLHPSKGQEVLLRAVPVVAGACGDVRVWFAGAGQERERLEGLAGELGVRDRVEFLGAVPREELLRRMGRASVCVVPSLSEAFGLVNIESMAVGTPVVASRVGGIPEIVRDGVDGLLFEPGNAEELAACLVRVLRDEGLRAEMGRNARQRFLEEFESTRMARRQAEWLEGLVRGARERSAAEGAAATQR